MNIWNRKKDFKAEQLDIAGGLIIDIFTVILTLLFSMEHPIWIDYCVEVIACVILAFGMTIVIKSDAGTGSRIFISCLDIVGLQELRCNS